MARAPSRQPGTINRAPLEAALGKLGRAIKAGAEASLEDVADAAEGACRRFVSGPGRGHVYTWRGADDGETPDSYRVVGGRVIPIKYRTIPHPSSAPGDPPAPDTGDLRDSIEAEARRDAMRVDLYAGGHEAPYAIYLELGTLQMAPRPFLVRSQMRNADALVEPVVEHIVRSIERAFPRSRETPR